MSNKVTPITLLMMGYIQAIHLALSKNDTESLRQMGLSYELANQISILSEEERNKMMHSDKSIFSIHINEHSLKLFTDSVKKISNKEKLLYDAIKLGASRSIMYDVANITAHQFTEMRDKIGLSGKKSRPLSLSEKEEEILNHYFRKTDIAHFKSKLELLVDAATKTKIEINRIERYYTIHMTME